jgi:putative flippase GtrA
LTTIFSRSSVQQWGRFLLGGGINTFVTYALYLAFKLAVGYQFAYLAAYVIGIVFSYWFNSRLVFKVPLSWTKFLSYPIVYVFQYCASALLLHGLVEFAEINVSFAPLMVTAAMVPLTYVTSKLILKRTPHG